MIVKPARAAAPYPEIALKSNAEYGISDTDLLSYLLTESPASTSPPTTRRRGGSSACPRRLSAVARNSASERSRPDHADASSLGRKPKMRARRISA